MAETPEITVRTDEDILKDVLDHVLDYDPMKVSRSHVDFAVNDGVVTVRGNVNSVRLRYFLRNEVPEVESVVAVEDDQLYDDDTLGLTVGKELPRGVRARVHHGHVVLGGRKPEDVDKEELMNTIGEIPGVVSVSSDFI